MKPAPEHEYWMRRCFTLARRGIGAVSPNPPVGAVLVAGNRLLGEGFHGRFGGPHAEVEAVASVSPEDRHLLSQATLYVSLEPCCITGKTPPCTRLILAERIPRVVISATDPNPAVSGQGVSVLLDQGVEVLTDILADEGRDLIRAFAVNIREQRPYIALKWAQSAEGRYGVTGSQRWLSDPHTRTWSHRLRAEADAIMVGARTVVTDDPALTTRDYPGRSPQRIVYDPTGRLADQSWRVWAEDGCRVFHVTRPDAPYRRGASITHIPLESGKTAFAEVFRKLYGLGIGHILVEGGAYLQQALIEAGHWDEAWVIRTRTSLPDGIPAPQITGRRWAQFTSGTDVILGIRNG